jgi:hypothetical protein
MLFQCVLYVLLLIFWMLHNATMSACNAPNIDAPVPSSGAVVQPRYHHGSIPWCGTARHHMNETVAHATKENEMVACGTMNEWYGGMGPEPHDQHSGSWCRATPCHHYASNSVVKLVAADPRQQRRNRRATNCLFCTSVCICLNQIHY